MLCGQMDISAGCEELVLHGPRVIDGVGVELNLPCRLHRRVPDPARRADVLRYDKMPLAIKHTLFVGDCRRLRGLWSLLERLPPDGEVLEEELRILTLPQ